MYLQYAKIPACFLFFCVSFAILTSCFFVKTKPYENKVFYGGGEVVNVNEKFVFIGTLKNLLRTGDYDSSMATTGISHRSYNFVVSDNGDVIEWLQIVDSSIGHGWSFTPKQDSAESYGSFEMPGNSKYEQDIYNLAKNKGLNFSGKFQYISFNHKFTNKILYKMTYAVKTKNNFENLPISDQNFSLARKALESVNSDLLK